MILRDVLAYLLRLSRLLLHPLLDRLLRLDGLGLDGRLYGGGFAVVYLLFELFVLLL